MAEKKLLGQVLLERNIVTEEEVEKALEQQSVSGKLLGRTLVDLGFCSEEDVLKALSAQKGVKSVTLDEMEIDEEVLEKVSPSMAQIYGIMPVSYEKDVLTVAVSDMLDVSKLDDLRFMLGCEVKGVVTTKEEIDKAIEKHYESVGESMDELLMELDDQVLEAEVKEADDEEAPDVTSLQEMASQAPIVKLLNLILVQAIKDQASDIHFEPFENEFKVRYRVDGVLYEMVPPPKHMALALISRIKVMADLNIAERRLPQDGRIMLNLGKKSIDLRISTLPTIFGESVVMRVLDREVVSLSLDQIGLLPEVMEKMRKLIEKPNGIILVTGPTGSGKTTTLYSALKDINKIDFKIITTEDPVEYDIAGIVQVGIRPNVGLTFAACLRSILRQDPDIIMVGEIRDVETAQMAIQASLTGHLVFSTLHTNDAPGAVTRLTDMGVEPFLITSTMEAILAQRLVRTICVRCKEEYEPDEMALRELSLTPADVKGKKFFYGKGCDKCNNTGYKGRVALAELLVMNDDLRVLIIKNAPTSELRKTAQEHGMKTLREGGLAKIYEGSTTIEEVARETLIYD